MNKSSTQIRRLLISAFAALLFSGFASLKDQAEVSAFSYEPVLATRVLSDDVAPRRSSPTTIRPPRTMTARQTAESDSPSTTKTSNAKTSTPAPRK